jgi:branched-chain amino acid transport system permease protein
MTRRALGAGLLGGAVVIYASMVGMVESFDELNLIGEQITLGLLLIAMPPLFAAAIAMRPRVVGGQMNRPTTGSAVAGGAVAGLISGGTVSAWLLLVHAIGVERVRSVFTSVSPTLIEILQFGQGWVVGSAILVAGGAALGAIGGAFVLAPLRVRRPIETGVTVVFLAALLQRILRPAIVELGVETDWLYSPVTFGLSWFGATVLFIASTIGSVAWDRIRAQRARGPAPEGMPRGRRRAMRAVLLIALVLALIALPRIVGSVISEVLGTVGIYVLLGLGLNIVVGYAGLLDLGYVAFFAVGAYGMALLTGASIVAVLGTAEPAFSADLSFYAAIPIVMLIAAGVGLLIGGPVLRLRGDYLAIVTLGFGEIARVLITSEWLKPFVGGAQGMRDVDPAPLFGVGFRDPQHFYYLVLSFCALAAFVSWRLARSRVGRAWNAMREDEQVAEAMGVSTINFKLLAFAIGGAIGSVGGALFAVKVGTVQPDSFSILVSITALAVVILGGLGSVPGVIVGALFLIGLPGLLSELQDYRLLIYGAVLVAIMILRPQGLVPNIRRTRELKQEEVYQDAWATGITGEGEAAAAVLPGGALGVEDEDLE